MSERPGTIGQNHSLLNGKRAHISDKGPDEWFRESCIVQIENVLNDIVSKWILNEVERVEDDFSDQLNTLSGASMVDRSLKDTTTVSMSSDFNEIGSNGIVDKLVVFRNELVQTFLNNLIVNPNLVESVRAYMVSVEILDERNDIHAESVDQSSDLLLLSWLSQKVDHFLNSSSPVHVETDPDEITSNRVDDGRSLLFGRILEQLLAKIVAERIDHEFREVSISLMEDHVTMSCFSLLELFLEVSTSVLVFAKREEVALKILDPDARESVDLL